MRPNVTISNLTLTGGTGTILGEGVHTSGGAIVSYGNLTVTGCTIQGNTATFGGGIFAQAGTLTMSNCSVVNNTATFGGGINISEFVKAVNITNSYISNNKANDPLLGEGGGIFITGGENVPINLVDVVMYNDSATIAGGGIYVENNQAKGGAPVLTIGFNTSITDCTATSIGSRGGGVYLGAGTLVVIGAQISFNTADLGAGLYLGKGTAALGDLDLVCNNVDDDIYQA